MTLLNEQDILANIKDQNSWWDTGKVDPELVPSFKRNEYENVRFVFFNKIRRFPVLSGPRRVGKSTIMYQLIDELLQSGVKPSQILFYTFDDYPNDEVSIKDVVRVYNKYIYAKSDFYLFVDEAQNDYSWKSYLKQLYDLNKQIRALVSGSSSIEIEKNSNDSGAGRFLTIKIPTISFYEFCELNNKKIDIGDIDVFKMHTLSLQEQTSIYLKLVSLYNEFIKYLKLGGFPEFAKNEHYSYVSKLIRDQVVTKAIRQDIPKMLSIRDVDALSNLYSYFCYHTSDVLNVDVISKALGIDRITCNLYIDALQTANLIYVSNQLDIGGKKSLKPKRKIYVSDYGIRCAVTRNIDVELNDIEMGYAIETVSFKHTYDYFMSLDDLLYTVGYSRGDTSDKEIDIVIKQNNIDYQYIEAKYRKKAHISDKDGIVVFGLKDVPGYVITKDMFDFGLFNRKQTSIYRIPALAYFYLLGKSKK